MHTLVQMVQARHDFSFCVEIVLNHGPSASTSAPDVRDRGVQNFEGPESRPPGPATALPYRWGDYYIKLNTRDVLLKPINQSHMTESECMMSNFLNFFRKNDQKMHFPLAFFQWGRKSLWTS